MGDLPSDVVTFLRGLVRDAQGSLPESAFDLGEWILADGKTAADLLNKYEPQTQRQAVKDTLRGMEGQ